MPALVVPGWTVTDQVPSLAVTELGAGLLGDQLLQSTWTGAAPQVPVAAETLSSVRIDGATHAPAAATDPPTISRRRPRSTPCAGA